MNNKVSAKTGQLHAERHWATAKQLGRLRLGELVLLADCLDFVARQQAIDLFAERHDDALVELAFGKARKVGGAGVALLVV